jgi:hypothetical protein
MRKNWQHIVLGAMLSLAVSLIAVAVVLTVLRAAGI